MQLSSLRTEVLRMARRAHAAGLMKGANGNFSARDPGSGLIVITPSGMPYDVMTEADLVVIRPDGTVAEGDRRPSSETPMHTHLYRTLPDVHAVAHTHSPYATALALLGRPIPPVLPEMIKLGEEVPVAPFALPGTQELGERVAETLRRIGARAALLQAHGALAVGRDPEEAILRALDLEEVAMVYVLALQIGDPPNLPSDTFQRLREVYGLSGR